MIIRTTDKAYDALRERTFSLPLHPRAFGPSRGHGVEVLILRTHKGTRYLDWKGFVDGPEARRWLRAWGHSVIEAVIRPVPYPDA